MSFATWFQDIQYGLRMLRNHPVLTAVAVISLAIGIGPNIAIFSVVNTFLLRPIPVERPDQLISLYTIDERNPSKLQLSYLNYQDLKKTLQPVVADISLHASFPLSMNSGDRPEQIRGAAVTNNYFDLLGVKAGHGRTFLPEEKDSAVVVLGYDFWRRRFGSDTNLVGQTLRLNRQPFTIIGVVPQGFTGTELGGGPDLWLPLHAYAQITPGISDRFENRRFLFLDSTARLQNGVSLAQVQSAIAGVSKNLQQEYPNENTGRTVKLIPLLKARVDPDEKGTYFLVSVVLMALVGITLLIACINVASLLLVRAMTREREIAIRVALGASRWRLIRQLLTESMTLAFMGGVIGLALAYFLKDVLWTLRPTGPLTYGLELSLDSRALIFTVIIALLSGLIFGLAPALYASRFDVVSMLKRTVNRRGRLGLQFNPQKILIVIQVALCLGSLIGAGLFLKSFQNAHAIDTGFNPNNMLLASLDMGFEGYDEEKGKQFYKQLVDAIKTLPGVQGAVLARGLPLREPYRRTVFMEGQDGPGGKGTLTATNQVGLGYFKTLGIPLLRGRDFSESDTESTPAVAIINEAMAQRYWPGENAVGRKFKLFGEDTFREIIGVAGNTNLNNIGEQPQPCLYLSLLQDYSTSVNLFVRTQGDPQAMVSAVQNQVRQLDSNLLLFEIQTLNERLDRALWATRAGASLFAALGALALVLAGVGLYGVMSYLSSRRTSEIGLRMALGAQKRDVLKLVFREGGILVISGIVIGMVAAVISMRLVTGLLFGVSSFDPRTFALSTLILVAAAFVAILIPARKATRTDPLIALRTE